MNDKTLKKVMSELGKRKSEKKAAASRRNGAKGGRKKAEVHAEVNKLRSDDIDPRFREEAAKIADCLDAILEVSASGATK